jgi:4-aminobutyrate aminotransferase
MFFGNKIKFKTQIPGPKSEAVLNRLKKLNGAWSLPYPFIQSNKGKGCYVKDIDGNVFLDFASQIASNPLGYNHPDLVKVGKKYAKISPLKRAGQDFPVEEHLEMLEELVSITPKRFDSAFLINSGAEAVENAVKIAMRKQQSSKVVVSFEGGFHGRTLGALSLTNTKKVHKQFYMSLNARRLPLDDTSIERFEHILSAEYSPEEVGCVIIEAVQGEGGYKVVPFDLMKKIRDITKKNNIPMICDEVQSGVGRTGKWWAYEYSGVVPDVQTSAKALQVGATISNKTMFPKEDGAISSTWGGGHLLDLALGIQTIRTIKKQNLLKHNTELGDYIRGRLIELSNKCDTIKNVRGLGLMNAFDLPSPKIRNNLLLGLLKKGIITLGCGPSGVRVIPPYVATEKEVDIFIDNLEKVNNTCTKSSFTHKGKICKYADCGVDHS